MALDDDPVRRPLASGVAAIHLATPDLERSVRLYGQTLGLPLVRTEPPPRRYFFLAGPALIVLEETTDPVVGNGAVRQVGLSLPNLDALEACRRRLLSAGLPVSGLENHGYAYLFQFRDATTGLLLHASTPARPFHPDDRRGDPQPPASATELLDLPAVERTS